MLRSFGAVIAGLLVLMVMVALVEYIGHAIFPFPPGVDPNNHEAVVALLPTMPVWALLFPLLAYAVGTFLGAGTATAISREHKRGVALAVGLVMLAMIVAVFVYVPVHPVWMMVTGVLIPLPSALLGWRLFR